MHVTDTEIERAIRNRVHALDSLPAVLMPFDPETGDSSETREGTACD